MFILFFLNSSESQPLTSYRNDPYNNLGYVGYKSTHVITSPLSSTSAGLSSRRSSSPFHPPHSMGRVPNIGAIDDLINSQNYSEAFSTINKKLEESPNAYPLMIRQMACSFILQKVVVLQRVCEKLANAKEPWVKGWAFFFSACIPLLNNNSINQSKMKDAFEITKDPVVGIFVLTALQKCAPDMKEALEAQYKVTLEGLKNSYREARRSPILSFAFLDDMLRKQH